ncbi:hypothetical protein [Rhodococcus sp. A5(2022)]|uniref:hypothetical protein n=1 Tax=Rhodococcus sp. A5(2022) TaxID=3003588 RepID=UPI0022A85496|nr:hypothetical protein [Rhodococcus sp. A5(2022)]MCZ1070824.1 hypothetical protein [Rhodococcus sp. A5(2022)]
MYAALRTLAQALADDPALSPDTRQAALDLVTAVTPAVDDHDAIGEASVYIG